MVWTCISTSSPRASVAVGTGGDVFSRNELGHRRATELPFAMLDDIFGETKLKLEDVDLLIADVGPGSFTGVKVGVTIVKTLAYSVGRMTAGILAFDLIAIGMPVAISIRRDTHLVRTDSGIVSVSDIGDIPANAVGQGVWTQSPVFPDAANAAPLIDDLEQLAPERLVPRYFADPGISKPRRPYPTVPE